MLQKIALIYLVLAGINGNLFEQHTYKIVYERIVMDYFNPSFFKSFHMCNTKFNRTIKTMSVNFENIVTLDDLSCTIQTYVFLSNQYRNFPMRWSVDHCKGVDKNYYGLAELTKIGNLTKCPMKPGFYFVKDLVLDSTKFPPNIPANRYKFTLQWFSGSTKILQADMFLGVEKIYRWKKPSHR